MLWFDPCTAGCVPAAPVSPGRCHTPCFSSASLPLFAPENTKFVETTPSGRRALWVFLRVQRVLASPGQRSLAAVSVSGRCVLYSSGYVARAVLRLSSVLVSRGGSRSSGVGSFSPAGSAASRPQPYRHEMKSAPPPVAERKEKPTTTKCNRQTAPFVGPRLGFKAPFR